MSIDKYIIGKLLKKKLISINNNKIQIGSDLINKLQKHYNTNLNTIEEFANKIYNKGWRCMMGFINDGQAVEQEELLYRVIISYR